ncbi:phage virion morphogenesis protein [Dyella acidisoli]|uniref:Virion morphogenesis protein n=1 Tax=Dyella acidisoli TaxID=1867834 RepID=A0ABQ5XP09_9GAMM|nr:phage virion morphogenesis protein [Dyella acidisoli]GLQ93460.1 virion morphogenesis protein [Dyella acidisoli]
MSDADLALLEDWVEGLLLAIRPAGRRRITQSVAVALRRSQQQRIVDQRNPDGTPYVPRKMHKLRNKAGRIKRGKMFTKLRTAKHFKTHATADAAVVAFTGRAARIARVHQYGLTDRVTPSGPRVRYTRRELLGFSAEDRVLVKDILLSSLTR